MKNWKFCTEYGIWVNMDRIDRITIDSSGEDNLYCVVAHFETTSLIIYLEKIEKCHKWLDGFMND